MAEKSTTGKVDPKEKWREYVATVKKVHTPSLAEWRREWKWVLIVVAGAIVAIMGVDWVGLKANNALVDFLPEIAMRGGAAETVFLIAYAICGLLTLGSVLLLRGSTGGLSSLLGSSVEYGAMSTAGFEEKVTRFMVTVASLFVLMTLLSPLFLS